MQVVVSNGADSRVTFTNSSGLYSVSGLAVGTIVAAATDPTTSLRGVATGTLSSGHSLTLNMQLAAFGSVSGTVLNVKGQAVGAGVTVSIAGRAGQLDGHGMRWVTTASRSCRWGRWGLDATDTNGNHGRTTAIITATAQGITANIQFLGKGTVSGVVTDGSGNPVAGAAVQLSNNGYFGQYLTTTTNGVGSYIFTGVFIGTLNVSASSSLTHTGGSATTQHHHRWTKRDGQHHADAGGQPDGHGHSAPTAQRRWAAPRFSLSNSGLTATTAANGTYSISDVPLGNVFVSAQDATSNDRGRNTVNLTTSGQTYPVTITMLGLGTINVTVEDGGGNIVPGAVVNVTSTAPYYQPSTGVTGSDGTVSIPQVLAGNFTVAATNPAFGLSGNAGGNLSPGGTTPITVMLQAAGTVQGTVYLHDGHTPLAGITIGVIRNNIVVASAITGSKWDLYDSERSVGRQLCCCPRLGRQHAFLQQQRGDHHAGPGGHRQLHHRRTRHRHRHGHQSRNGTPGIGGCGQGFEQRQWRPLSLRHVDRHQRPLHRGAGPRRRVQRRGRSSTR